MNLDVAKWMVKFAAAIYQLDGTRCAASMQFVKSFDFEGMASAFVH
jgi:hypothetical protein